MAAFLIDLALHICALFATLLLGGMTLAAARRAWQKQPLHQQGDAERVHAGVFTALFFAVIAVLPVDLSNWLGWGGFARGVFQLALAIALITFAAWFWGRMSENRP